MTQHRTFWIALLLAALAVSAAGWAAGEQEVTSTGKAAIMTDKAAAETEAKAQAARNAVEQVLGAMIKAESLSVNFELVKDEVSVKASGFAKCTKVVSVTVEDGNVVVFTGIFKVSEAGLKDILEDLLAAKRKPRLAIVIDESYMNKPAFKPSAETAMLEYLVGRGFPMVNQAQMNKLREGDALKQAIAGNQSAAAALALDLGAEVLLIGSCTVNKAEELSPYLQKTMGSMKSLSAVIQMQAVRTANAAVMGAASDEAKGVNINEVTAAAEAAGKAGKKIAEKMDKQLVDWWNKELMSGMTLKLTVSNVKFKQLKALEEALSSKLPEIKKFNRRFYGQNVAKIDIETTAPNAQDLADKICSLDFEGFGLDITGFQSDSIDLEVTSGK